ncbi:hypothetical protein Bca101_073019 [Brassica carinata]
MEITRNLRDEKKRKLKESGGVIGGVESKTLETLYTSPGERPCVNTNLATNIEDLPRRRSPRGLLHNQCGVSGGMTAFSNVTEGKERQKPASSMEDSHGTFVSGTIGQQEIDLANSWEENVPLNGLDATFVLEFALSQTFSMLFRDSLGSTETERNTLVLEDFS